MSSRKRYPMRSPRFATGIKAQETRVSTLRCWWSKEWSDRIDQIALGSRLGRGRNYAASGQVTSIRIKGSRVVAEVQGARPDPYRVTLDFRCPEGEARERIVASLKAEPMNVARILADDLPLEVGTIFKHEGFDIFPGCKLAPGKYDMSCDCSCPDYANPCKHVIAVLVVLGEEIARRPALLLELRGIGIKELLK